MLSNKIYRHIHHVFAFIVLVISSLVMVGWIIRNPDLIQIRDDFAPMVFNTALSLAALSLCSLLLDSRYFRWARYLAGGVFLISGLTILQYLLGFNFGLDSLFINPFYSIGTAMPGRMSVSTAVNFMILSYVWSLKKSRYNSKMVCVMATSLVIGFSLIGILSYVGGFNSEYGWGSFSRMALHTSASFLLLSLATLWHLRLEVRKVSSREVVLVPFYVLIVGILTSVLIWQLLILRDQERNRKVTQIRVDSLKTNFDNVFAPLEKALEHMARRFASNGYPNQSMWQVDAESYYQEFQGLKRIFWADKNAMVQWAYPTTDGAEMILNTKIGSNNKELDFHLKEIISGKNFSLSKVFEFRTGGRGFIFFVPIFKETKYYGTVAATLLSEPFFSKVMKIDGYDIEIFEDGKKIYQRGNPDPVFARDWTLRSRYGGLGVQWDIKITPVPETIRENTSALPGVVLFFGVSVTMLLGLALKFYNHSRESERVARAALEWKKAGMNSAPLLIISLDLDTTIREMNATAENFLGYSTEELAGKSSPLMFYDPAEVRAFQQKMEAELGRPILLGKDFMEALFKLGYHRASEWTQVSRTGERYTVINSTSEIYDEDGNVSGYLQILEDVTALKEKERLIKEQELRFLASSRLASLGEMAAGIAHEINNPLAIINGHVGVLRRMIAQKGLDQDQDLMKKVDAVESVVQRIAKIIKGLRGYSRESEIGTGEWIEVSALVEDTLSFCEERFRFEGVTLSRDIAEGLRFKVHSHQISQVLLNLLNNSLDAVSDSREKRVSIEALERWDGIEISISDTGPGIPYDLRARIMQPFFTTKEVGKGVGLGLSISQGIVQAHAGKFYLDENSARTKFVIWIPKDV